MENNSERPIMDISILKNVGLKRIEELSGSIWTDYNPSDPGITLLEILCFAILDLGYRMTFDIRDLLTEEGYINPEFQNVFYEPYEILPSAPLTIDDYRKLILQNVEGVQNVWFEAKKKSLALPSNLLGEGIELPSSISISGFYDVYVDCNEDGDKGPEETKKKIKHLLQSNRNLCETFDDDDIKFVESIPVAIDASIEVDLDYDYTSILQEIIRGLSEYVSPRLSLYSLEEMLQKGKSVADIFTGPLPTRGFVDIDEVEELKDSSTLYASDMINIVMQIKGVTGVRHLRFLVPDKYQSCVDISKEHKIGFKAKEAKNKVFRFSGTNFEDGKAVLSNHIEFLLEDFRFVAKLPSEPNQASSEEASIEPHCLNYRFSKDQSKNRLLDSFYSIQEEFPEIYKVGKEGISEWESDERKAQRLQMKAYLMFFDQLLLDFQMRLNSAKRMLSWEKRNDKKLWLKKQKSYLHRVLTETEVDDLKSLVEQGYASYGDDIFDPKAELERGNKALNHLLARFNEDFVRFSIFQYVYTGRETELVTEEDKKFALIESKSELLDNLPKLSYRRTTAINLLPLEKKNEREGNSPYDDSYYAIERKLSIKFGILSYDSKKELHPKICSETDKEVIFEDNRKASCAEAFGLHVYEHQLLVPKEINVGNFFYQYKSEDSKEYATDPYSMKVTVALPGWLDIVQNAQFRDIVEAAILEEFPAHIAVKICWINPLQMLQLEREYKTFLSALRVKQEKEEALTNFVEILSRLKNIYQEVYTDSQQNLLGYTTIGRSCDNKTYQWVAKCEE